MFVGTPITTGSLLRLFVSNKHSYLRYEYVWTETFSEPFNGTVSFTVNVVAFVSIPEPAVEEFATTSGWHAALNIKTAASVSGVILRIISPFDHLRGNNDKN